MKCVTQSQKSAENVDNDKRWLLWFPTLKKKRCGNTAERHNITTSWEILLIFTHFPQNFFLLTLHLVVR